MGLFGKKKSSGFTVPKTSEALKMEPGDLIPVPHGHTVITVQKHQAKVVVYRDRKGAHRWQFRARNGKIIADSAESYVSRRNARAAAHTFIKIASTARVEEKY